MGSLTPLVESNMKIVHGLLFLLGVAYVSGDCYSCLQSVVNMQTYLRTTKSLNEQISLVTSEGCTKDPNPTDCQSFIKEHWQGLAANMYQNFMEAQEVCDEIMGLCPNPQPVFDSLNIEASTATLDPCEEYYFFQQAGTILPQDDQH